jgi:hypothetical protein
MAPFPSSAAPESKNVTQIHPQPRRLASFTTLESVKPVVSAPKSTITRQFVEFGVSATEEKSSILVDLVASSTSNSQQENFRTAGYAHPRRVVPRRRINLGYVRPLAGSGWYERGGYGLAIFSLSSRRSILIASPIGLPVQSIQSSEI